MKKYLKFLILLSFFSAIIGCQNQSNINPKPLNSRHAIDKSTPITLIGGELGYEFINSIDNPYRLYGIKINPKNSNIIVYGDSSKIIIYNTALQTVKVLKSKNSEVTTLDISHNGKYLACSGDDGYIDVWDLDGYKKLYSIDTDSKNLAISISSDSKKIAVGGEKEVIDIYDLQSKEQLARLKGHNGEITNIGFIDYNRKIVSTATDSLVKIWSVNRKREIYSYLAPSNEYGKIIKAKSFDDYTILALTEVDRAEGNSRRRAGPPVWRYTIKFKDNQGNTLNEFNEHREPITDIAVADNRAYMATSSRDRTVRLWDLEKKRHITNIVLKDRANGVAINKSGYILATIEGNSKIKLYQITNEYDPTLKPSSSADTPTVSNLNLPSWYKNQYAIVVGIDHYKRLSIPRLNNAVNDARAVAELLRKKGFKVIELYNENATKEKILDALKRVKELATDNDATLFYFAGHGEGVSGYNGVREGYILPYDFSSDLNNPNADVMYYDKSAISIGSLVMYARDTKAKHIGLILDSCFSGLAMDSKYAKKSLNSSTKSLDEVSYDYKTRSVRIKPTKVSSQNSEINNLFKNLLQKKSINILTAGDDQPVADGSNHSPFTQALLNTLNGKDVSSRGFVRFSTLAEYIKRFVENRTKNRQRPQYKNESSEGGDFIFKI